MATFPTSLVLLAACYLLIGDHVSAYSNLVPRFHHTMEIVNGQLCVFGGKSVSTYTNISDYLLDYRCVDITKPIQQARPHWNVLSSASQFAMPPLAQHTSVYNRKSHVIIPYGGQSPYMFSANDIFSIFCTKFQAWDASTTHNTVPRRYLHTAVLQESSGDMIVFGGASDPTTDTQEYSRWTNPARVVTDPALHSAHAALVGNTTNNVPVGHITIDHGDAVPENVTLITHHSSILVNDTHMVVLGGNRWNYTVNATVNVTLDRVYVYDVDMLTWRPQDCTGDIPRPRSAFSASLYKDSIFIFAGVDPYNYSRPFNDLYQLNITTWTWRNLTTAAAPVPRYGHQMKTLGKYLIVTHGYILPNPDKGIGDENIYFYDIEKQSFVSMYSPRDISSIDLDTQWLDPLTPTSKAIFSLTLILQILVCFLALYYLATECWRVITSPGSTQHSRTSARARIRSRVLSVAETARRSSYFTQRQSVDEQTISGQTLDGELARPSVDKLGKLARPSTDSSQMHGAHKDRSQSVSEGSSTAVGNDQMQRLRSQSVSFMDNMRHTRIIDDNSEPGPYVSRKLTVSARLPSYARQLSARGSQERTVRFSDFVNAATDDEASEIEIADDIPLIDLSEAPLGSVEALAGEEENPSTVVLPLKVVNNNAGK